MLLLLKLSSTSNNNTETIFEIPIDPETQDLNGV